MSTDPAQVALKPCAGVLGLGHTDAFAPVMPLPVVSAVVAALKVLANENRLLLLSRLARGELCVGALEAELGIHQPTLSQQLGILRTEGFVFSRRQGRRTFYRIADSRASQTLKALAELSQACVVGPDIGTRLG